MFEEMLHMLGDPAHWGFEIVSGTILGATLSPLVRWVVKRHDRKHHSERKHDHVPIYTEIESLRMEVWALKQRIK